MLCQRDGRVDFPPASVHVQRGQKGYFLVEVEGAVDQREGQHDVSGGRVHETVCARQRVARVAFHDKLVFSVEVRITVECEILARGAERKIGPHAVAPMFGHDVESLHVRVDPLDGFREWNVKEFVDAFAVHKEPHLEPRVVGGAPVEIEFGVCESNNHLSCGDVGAVAVPTFVLCVAADGVAVCVLGAGDVAASGVGERVDADAGERVARVESAGVAVKTVLVCFRVDPVHAECVGAHVGVVYFVGGFERATDVGEAHANITRFVGAWGGCAVAHALGAGIVLGAEICIVAGGPVGVLHKDVLCAGMTAPCDGITAADACFAHVVVGALGSVVAGGIGERDGDAGVVGAHLLVAGKGGAVGGVRAAVVDGFESAQGVALCALAGGGGAVQVGAAKVKEIGEEDGEHGEGRETQTQCSVKTRPSVRTRERAAPTIEHVRFVLWKSGLARRHILGVHFYALNTPSFGNKNFAV